MNTETIISTILGLAIAYSLKSLVVFIFKSFKKRKPKGYDTTISVSEWLDSRPSKEEEEVREDGTERLMRKKASYDATMSTSDWRAFSSTEIEERMSAIARTNSSIKTIGEWKINGCPKCKCKDYRTSIREDFSGMVVTSCKRCNHETWIPLSS